jgi:hypothetical protein
MKKQNKSTKESGDITLGKIINSKEILHLNPQNCTFVDSYGINYEYK